MDAGGKLIPEFDIYRTVNVLVKQHGEDAPIHAAMRADELLAAGDVEGCADGSEFLKGLHVPELRHRALSSSERLMRVFGPIVEPATALLSGNVTDHLHHRTV